MRFRPTMVIMLPILRRTLRPAVIGGAVTLALAGAAAAQQQPAQQGAEPLPAPLLPPAQRSGAPAAGQAQRGGVLSQGVVKEQHGAWRILCESIDGPGADRCALVQNVESAERPGFGLVVMVLKTPDGKTRMRVAAPAGIFLPPGLGLRVDGKAMGNAPFWFCTPFACETEAIVTDELMKSLKSGKEALFVIYERPEKGTGLVVSLDGFTAGHQALAVWHPPPGQPAPGGAAAPPAAGQSVEAPSQK